MNNKNAKDIEDIKNDLNKLKNTFDKFATQFAIYIRALQAANATALSQDGAPSKKRGRPPKK